MSNQRHALSLAWWALPPLLLQCIALNWSAPLTWPTWALVLCALFKLRESRRPFDRRLVALLQLVSTGLLAAQLQGLLASTLQVLSVLLADEINRASLRTHSAFLEAMAAAGSTGILTFLGVARVNQQFGKKPASGGWWIPQPPGPSPGMAPPCRLPRISGSRRKESCWLVLHRASAGPSACSPPGRWRPGSSAPPFLGNGSRPLIPCLG